MSSSLGRRIALSRALLQNPYAYLNDEGRYAAIDRRGEESAALADVAQFVSANTGPRSRRGIEALVRKVQRWMWKSRHMLLGKAEVRPVDILDPVLALHALGFNVELRESLGLHAAGRESFEVAGVVDRERRTVGISRRFAPAIRNFTAAHELGHVLLHAQSGLHRDRSPEGRAIRERDSQEVEADVFASCFLLPEKLVREAFERRFGASRFELTEATAFALNLGSLAEARRACRNVRDLARLLAGTHQYDGRHFISLTDYFRVSTEVMAIRLEELGLL